VKFTISGWSIGDDRIVAARRAGLEGVEKGLPAPSTARTRRSETLGRLLHPRPLVASLDEVVPAVPR
jgi:hypothetical protein